MSTIYLAGPDVFLPDADRVLARKAAIIRAAGFEPLVPGDISIQPSADRRAWGLAISDVDRRIMLDSEIIIANLTPFRGISTDPGTVFEIGFMCGLGREVHGYSNTIASHFDRTKAYYGSVTRTRADGSAEGPDGLALEDFGLADNLMLEGSIAASGGFFVCAPAETSDVIGSLSAFRQCVKLIAARHDEGP